MNTKDNKTITLICAECGTSFSVSIHRKNTAKFCSRLCKDVHQVGCTPWNKNLKQTAYKKRVVALSNECLNCGKPVKNKYCNHSCQLSFQNKQTKGKTYVDLHGEKRAKQKRLKISVALSNKAYETGFTKIGASAIGKIRKGKTIESLYGKEKASEIKEKIRIGLNEFRKTPKGIKQRQATSEMCIKAVLSGKTFANSKKGTYRNVFYGSSLEESFLKQCYRLLGTLKNIQRNKTEILSTSDSFHKTIPDYCIVDENGIIIGLVECKWEKYMETSLTYDKACALYYYGKNNGLRAGYFTYNTLNVFKQILGNPEPRRLNSLYNCMEKELYDYVVNRKVQRLGVADKDTNKTPETAYLNGSFNYPLPFSAITEDDIVRHPLKSGVCL